MAISFTRPDPASPASVSAAQFPTSRRGYDQAEVRDFLRMVAAEQARLQERERSLERELKALQQSSVTSLEAIDEDTATRLLGEEAARVLQAAREAAAQIRTRAEEAGARLLREATDEAQRMREEAEIESARRRHDAAADSEAELNMAKQQGRDMVNEARAYRERVLSELARRRELARQQIEQLIHGRDRLLQAFERARVAAVEVMAELTPLGEPVEYVNLQPTTGPVPMMVPSGDPTSGGHAVDLGELVREAVDAERDGDPTALIALVVEVEATAADEDLDDPTGDAGDTSGTDHRPDLHVVEDVADDGGDGGDEAVDAGDVDDVDGVVPATDAAAQDNADGTTADGLTDDTTVSDPGASDTEDEQTADGADEQPADADAAPVADAGGTDDGGEVVELFGGEHDTGEPKVIGAKVEDLFARLRAARTDEVARATEHGPSDAPTDGSSALTIVDGSSADDTDSGSGSGAEAGDPVPPVDEILVPLIVSAARKLKRVLADEQNDLLDTLRRKEPIRSLDVLLPWEADQSARYVTAVEADLLAAATAGAQGGENGRNPAIIRPAVDAVTNEIVAPLRDRLIRCIDKADGDNTDLGNQVRSLYREWKTQRIDDHVEDIVRLAYDRGALTIASR